MFDTKLFGYDKDQVREKFDLLYEKIDIQQRDIDYLRIENDRLNKKLLQSSKIMEDQSER